MVLDPIPKAPRGGGGHNADTRTGPQYQLILKEESQFFILSFVIYFYSVLFVYTLVFSKLKN